MNLNTHMLAGRRLKKFARCFVNFICAKEPKFSVLSRSNNVNEPSPARLHEYSDDLESIVSSHNVVERKRNLQLSDNIGFRQDKTFLKFLAWINLESKDQESISIARLVAYNIFSQLKNEEISDDVISGIVKGLRIILKYFTSHRKNIRDDTELVEKACKAYSKGLTNVIELITYMINKETPKDLIFTKEIVGRVHEGKAKVHNSLNLNVGHTSHTFINDELNYRVDLKQPIIIMKETLSIEDVDDVFSRFGRRYNNILVITKESENLVIDHIVEKNKTSRTQVTVTNLSECDQAPDDVYSILISLLPNHDQIKSDSLLVKTADRVLLDANSTYFINSSFEDSEKLRTTKFFKELVEVHLRSPNEAWIHQFKNDINDAYVNLQDSLEYGILPEKKSSFHLANDDLKSYLSENPDLQRGIEVVQKAIDSTILSNEGSGELEFSFEDHMNESLADGSFIPANAPTKIIGDVVTICNYLLQNKEE